LEAGIVRKLTLESLNDNIPIITNEAAGFFKENCMVCFHNQGYTSGVELKTVYKESNTTFAVCWSGNVTKQMLRNYSDLSQAAEHAACAIAFLLIRELTDYVTIEQAAKGKGIDYFLVPKNQNMEDDLIFNHTAGLEVSGILKESPDNTVDARINGKIKRLKRLKPGLPVVIVVVEFSKPWSKMVEHE